MTKAARNIARKAAHSNAFIKAASRTKGESGAALGSLGEVKHGAGKGAARVAVKDNIATYGSSTTCASGILKDYVSPFEATVVDRVRRKHSTQGKTNMDEFGMGSHSTNSFFGAVRHHQRHDHSAGGSSGGSAAAVASGARDFALGTDTGGSVRLPAAYTGVVGFKPSYGRISRWGVVPYANSLDTVGILAHRHTLQPTPEGSSLWSFLKDIDAHDERDPTSVTAATRTRIETAHNSFTKSPEGQARKGLKKLHIGVPIEYNIQELYKPIHTTWITILRRFQAEGHTVVAVSLPSTKHALSAYYVLAAAEAASNLAKYDGVRYGTRTEGSDGSEGVLYAGTRGQGFGDEVKRRILLGSYSLSSEAIDNHFIQAQRIRRLVQRDFDRVFAMPNPLRPEEQFDLSEMPEEVDLADKRGPPQVDVLVCPTAPTLPPLLEEVERQTSVDGYMNDVFTVPASLAGIPAISVPVNLPDGMRVDGNVDYTGIQVIGQYWDDELVLRVGGLICDSDGP